jgi:hypothetical protein
MMMLYKIGKPSIVTRNIAAGRIYRYGVSFLPREEFEYLADLPTVDCEFIGRPNG